MKTTSVVSITMPTAMLKGVRATAKEENRTMSELVREALRQYTLYSQFKSLQAEGIKQTKQLGIKPRDVQRLIEEVRQGR